MTCSSKNITRNNLASWSNIFSTIYVRSNLLFTPNNYLQCRVKVVISFVIENFCEAWNFLRNCNVTVSCHGSIILLPFMWGHKKIAILLCYKVARLKWILHKCYVDGIYHFYTKYILHVKIKSRLRRKYPVILRQCFILVFNLFRARYLTQCVWLLPMYHNFCVGQWWTTFFHNINSFTFDFLQTFHCYCIHTNKIFHKKVFPKQTK